MNRSAHPPELSDADLVRGAQQGDQAAFAELVTRYQDRVYNTCYRMCHQHADAADLTQTTLLKAWEALGTFKRGAGFYTWLFRIALNTVLSHRRQRRRRETVPLEMDPDGGRRGGGGGVRAAEPESALAQRELQERVARALSELDDEFRAAVILKDIEELDYQTIAEILEVPLGTVKSRIHRGRTMLRELLHDVRSPLARGA